MYQKTDIIMWTQKEIRAVILMPLFPREVQVAQYSKYKLHYWLAVMYLDSLHTLRQLNHQKRH